MKPVLAITMGDFNGVGPEIVLKSVNLSEIRSICVPVVVGSLDVFEYYAVKLRLRMDFKEIDSIPLKNINGIIPVFHLRKFQKPRVNPGMLRREAGEFAGDSLIVAADLAKRKFVDGVVTAPVSKEALKLGGYNFKGQTEILSDYCRVRNNLMLFTAKNMKVGLATTHLPLSRVSSQISKKYILDKIVILQSSLKNDFGIRFPVIDVLGLNPHAGEGNLLGMEERESIIPSVREARRRKINVRGPFPADAYFGSFHAGSSDAILALYHDQGLIPFKMLNFDSGVNFTAGLPIVRTSPDHGTAFGIAAKGIASPESMIQAIRTAVRIINNRKRRRS